MQDRAFIAFPDNYDSLTEAEQLAVCERMAEAMQDALLPALQKRGE